MMPMANKKRLQRGFNILELMVVLFVGSILIGVGVPAFNNFVDNGRMAASSNDLTTSIHMARTEAIKRKSVIVICPSTTWNTSLPTCNWTTSVSFDDGWIIFEDSATLAAANMQAENADALIYSHGPMQGDMGVELASRDGNEITTSRKYIMYDTDGFPEEEFSSDPAVFNVQLCDSRGDENTGGGISAGRWIQIGPTGRPQIHRTQEALESAANPVGGCGASSS